MELLHDTATPDDGLNRRSCCGVGRCGVAFSLPVHRLTRTLPPCVSPHINSFPEGCCILPTDMAPELGCSPDVPAPTHTPPNTKTYLVSAAGQTLALARKMAYPWRTHPTRPAVVPAALCTPGSARKCMPVCKAPRADPQPAAHLLQTLSPCTRTHVCHIDMQPHANSNAHTGGPRFGSYLKRCPTERRNACSR
jgi:hypothetical protein